MIIDRPRIKKDLGNTIQKIVELVFTLTVKPISRLRLGSWQPRVFTASPSRANKLSAEMQYGRDAGTSFPVSVPSSLNLPVNIT